MNEDYLQKARSKVDNVCVLINGIAKRGAELAHGGKPLVPKLPEDKRTNLDIALLEVAEGKVVIEQPDLYDTNPEDTDESASEATEEEVENPEDQ